MGLGHYGFTVRTAPDGPAALSLVEEWEPQAIILDIMLPQIDGITLLPMLRRLTEAPVLMLSAKGDVEDRITGLSRGADDYINKPFDLAELAARLRTALRRPNLDQPQTLSFADLTVDLRTRRVSRGGTEIELSPHEYDLLVTLLRRPRQVFPKEQLLDLVWGVDAELTLGTVDRFISYLRAKVDAGHDRHLIATIRGIGYSLRDG
jgi:DNA-binding response OmpR family regulator